MSKILQAIQHAPYGDEHPYRQGPEERYPRDPLEGEAIEIGALTYPAGAAERVWLTWRINEEEHTVPAEGKSGEEAGGSGWKAVLPALKQGEEVHYWLRAEQGETSIETERFSFTVRGWRAWSGEARIEYLKEGLQIWLVDEAGGNAAQVRLDLQDSRKVGVKISAGGDWAEAARVETGTYQVVEESQERAVVETEALRLVVQRNPYRLEIYHKDGRPLLVEAEPPAWLVGERGAPKAVRQTFVLEAEEGFYGFGERFNAMNQRGNRLDVRVFEQFFAEGRRTYMPMPYFLSPRGYGMLLDTNRCVEFDLGKEAAERWYYEAETSDEGALEYTLMVGDPVEVLHTFSETTGKPALPPTWAFGPWMSGNEWNSQKRVEEELQQTLDLDIPCTVLVIEAWSDESTFYIWNDAEYSPKDPSLPPTLSDFAFPEEGKWPDPKGMIERLHELGIRIVLWQIPVMKKLEEEHAQHNANEAYFVEKGYYAQNPDGTPYRVRPFWFNEAMLVDFSSEEAASWFLDKRAYLVDEMGVDGFKTDGGEHLWMRDSRFANGMSGEEMWNLYPNLYVGAYYKFITEKRDGDAICFSRAGYTGAQRYPLHWGGDEYSTWETLSEAITAGLNSGLCGLPFWGWDIGGFSGETPTAELYIRSTAMAAFCPVMQYHSDFNHHRTPKRDRTPWNIAERTGTAEVVDIYRRYAKMRMKLLPYIEAEAAHCAESGEPLMRPLLLDWPEDRTAWKISDQYCFGRSLLVAPVIEPDTVERRLYLPAGEWQDVWDGTVHSGGQWIRRAVPLDVIPVYRRLDQTFGDYTFDLG
jgi:alpha-glucosidase (family GH31 glycosyl hydrolase)